MSSSKLVQQYPELVKPLSRIESINYLLIVFTNVYYQNIIVQYELVSWKHSWSGNLVEKSQCHFRCLLFGYDVLINKYNKCCEIFAATTSCILRLPSLFIQFGELLISTLISVMRLLHLQEMMRCPKVSVRLLTISELVRNWVAIRS